MHEGDDKNLETSNYEELEALCIDKKMNLGFSVSIFLKRNLR